MGFFDTKEGVQQYIDMAQGFDGRKLIDFLRKHLPEGSSILELGMGPGKDVDILSQYFQVVGSDYSQLFTDRYLLDHPKADVVVLDAITLETSRRFDAIYSNKVLHQFSREDVRQSLKNQHRALNPGGLALHSLWFGDTCEQYGDMLAQHYTLDSFSTLLGDHFELVDHYIYEEMEADDSLCVLLKARPAAAP